MTNIATRTQFLQNMAKGKGVLNIGVSTSGIATTVTSNANDGFHTGQILANRIGSTLPGTLQTLMLPPITSAQQLMLNIAAAGSSVGNNIGLYLARIYKFGTVALTGTAPLNVFTHDAATFPVKKTQFGVASTALNLLPMLQITTATTTTAAAMILKATAGTTGYVNQDGSNVVGTTTFTLPAAATATGSSYFMPLEAGDSGVQDIVQIDLTTSASAGAATMWGVDILCALNSLSSLEPAIQDSLFSGITMIDLAPAVAASGTAVSNLVILSMNNTTDAFSFVIGGALNV